MGIDCMGMGRSGNQKTHFRSSVLKTRWWGRNWATEQRREVDLEMRLDVERS